MWICASESGLRKALIGCLLGLSVAGILFYRLQNAATAPGGAIAPVKVIWLAAALLFWYLLPMLFLLDRRITGQARRTMILFLGNMGLRAGAELWLMYADQSWHPFYGIGHDLFSAGLCVGLVWWLPKEPAPSRLLRHYFLVMAVMFLVETGFAVYLLTALSPTGEAIYFIPPEPRHRVILGITWLSLALLAGYWVFLIRHWLYEPITSRDSVS